jgi:hypothetical protein
MSCWGAQNGIRGLSVVKFGPQCIRASKASVEISKHYKGGLFLCARIDPPFQFHQLSAEFRAAPRRALQITARTAGLQMNSEQS